MQADSRDPVRIVYHTEHRTFARLFNERSLDDIKDVVRRKLRLGKDTRVSLKQMGSDAFLDLEDDDDFRAFRVFVKSSVTVDIQVTVGESRGFPLPPRSRERASEAITASGEPAVSSQLNSRSHSTESRSAPPQTPRERKRKVSFEVASPTFLAVAEPSISAPLTKEPSTKRQKKETTKKKDTKQSEVAEGREVSRASKPRARKAAALESGDEEVENTSNDAEASQFAAKKSRKTRKDPNVVPKKSSTSRASKSAIDTLPQASGSAADNVDEANELPPDPPAPSKSKAAKKATKKTATSARAVKATAKSTSNGSTDQPDTSHWVVPPCPICQAVPFHIRYFCPIFLKGPDAIRARLEEIRGTELGKKEWLIEELEDLIRDSKAPSEPPLDAAPANGNQIPEKLPSPLPVAVPISSTPNAPANSCPSEVAVENKNEGSSSESSDEMSDREAELKELPTLQKRQTIEEPSSIDDDLDAVIQGPTSKRQSILNVLDRIIENEDEEEDEAELEEDPDEESCLPKRRLPKRPVDSASEEEDSGSSLPPRSPERNIDSPRPVAHTSHEPLIEPAEQQDGDVIMKEPAEVPVVEEQNGDSGETTQLGSDGRVVMDELDAEKDTSTGRPPSLVPQTLVIEPADDRSDEPQGPGQTEVGLSSDGISDAPGADGDPMEMDVDPIEPIDDMESPAVSRLVNTDPIEAPSENIGALPSSVTQSTPKPGVAKRIKTRNGQILDDEAEGPILLEQLSTEVPEEVPPLSTKRKRKGRVSDVIQEPLARRQSPRFSAFPPKTPLAATLLNRRTKLGARSVKATEIPAKRSGTRNDSSQTKDDPQSGLLPTDSPSARWETLAEPSSSPSVHPDEPPAPVDELIGSTPQLESQLARGRSQKRDIPSRKLVSSGESEDSQEEERLFDLSSSQIPFPYSQYQDTPVPMELPNGEEVEATDSEEDKEPKVIKARKKPTTLYRPLSQLASQAALFSPTLPTPATSKSMANGKAKKRVPDEDSSSSSSDTDEANGSEHIPRGRRAGSVFRAKKKKGLLSMM